MNAAMKAAYDDRIESLVQEFTNKGFAVIAGPAKNDMPFDLGFYLPDVIATKEGAGFLFEVRTRAGEVSVDRMTSIADEVATHPGWRFMLVSLDDVNTTYVPTDPEELPSWQRLQEKIAVANSIAEQGMLEPAALYLWSSLEAAMRKRALFQNIPIARMQMRALVDYMHSQGEIAVDRSPVCYELMKVRDRLVHGADDPVPPAMLALAFQTVGVLVAEWAQEKMWT